MAIDPSKIDPRVVKGLTQVAKRVFGGRGASYRAIAYTMIPVAVDMLADWMERSATGSAAAAGRDPSAEAQVEAMLQHAGVRPAAVTPAAPPVIQATGQGGAAAGQQRGWFGRGLGKQRIWSV